MLVPFQTPTTEVFQLSTVVVFLPLRASQPRQRNVHPPPRENAIGCTVPAFVHVVLGSIYPMELCPKFSFCIVTSLIAPGWSTMLFPPSCFFGVLAVVVRPPWPFCRRGSFPHRLRDDGSSVTSRHHGHFCTTLHDHALPATTVLPCFFFFASWLSSDSTLPCTTELITLGHHWTHHWNSLCALLQASCRWFDSLSPWCA